LHVQQNISHAAEVYGLPMISGALPRRGRRSSGLPESAVW
jgi:hypothetical protein